MQPPRTHEREEGPGEASLGARALRGSAWTAMGYGGSQFIRLVGNLLIARLLFPEAFGLMALVYVVLTGLAMFSDLGISPMVVQSRRGDERRFLDTAWTIQVLRGGILFGAACALTWPMADFYGQPELLQLIPVSGLSVLIDGFTSTSLLRLQRHLQLAKLTLVELASQIAAVVVMLTWGFIDRSVWAMVAGALGGALAKTLLSHLISGDPLNRFAWERRAAGELLNFGKWVFLSSALAFVVGQSDRLVLGKLTNIGELGVYNIAVMLSLFPTLLMIRVGVSVVFPAFSRILEQGGELSERYASTRRGLLALGGLLVAGLFATAHPLIATLYDERYAAAGWMLQLLSTGAWVTVLGVASGSAVMAHGAPRWLALSNGWKLIGIVVLVPPGYLLWGLPGAIAGFCASELCRYGTQVVGARRFGLPALRLDLLATALVALAMLGGSAVDAALAARGLAPLPRLVCVSAATLLAWLPACVVLMRHDWRGAAAAAGIPVPGCLTSRRQTAP